MRWWSLFFIPVSLMGAEVIVPTPQDMCGTDSSCLRRTREAMHLHREQQKTLIESSSPKGSEPVPLGEAEKSVPDFQKVRGSYKGLNRDKMKDNSYSDLLNRERAKGPDETRGTDYQMRSWNPRQKPLPSDYEQFLQSKEEEERRVKEWRESEARKSELGKAPELPKSEELSAESVPPSGATKPTPLEESARRADVGPDRVPLGKDDSSEDDGNWIKKKPPKKPEGYIRIEQGGKKQIFRTGGESKDPEASYIELTP